VAHPVQDDAKALAQLILNEVCLVATLLDGRSHKDHKNLRVLSLSGGFSTLPEQLDAGLKRLLDVVHSGLDVRVGQLAKPRNHLSLGVSVVTRVDLHRQEISYVLQPAVDSAGSC